MRSIALAPFDFMVAIGGPEHANLPQKGNSCALRRIGAGQHVPTEMNAWQQSVRYYVNCQKIGQTAPTNASPCVL
jgi:hypothetical protein